MTIRYQNGQTDEAIILSRTDTAMRVILRNSDDVLELQFLSGAWVTDDCEPITVEFGSRRTPGAPITEKDCICSVDLAAYLIHLLLTDSSEDMPEAPGAARDHKVCATARTA